MDSGEEFELTVQARDACERLSATYRGTVRFSIDSDQPEGSGVLPSAEAELPGAYIFSGRR